MQADVFAERIKTLYSNSPVVLGGGTLVVFITAALLWTSASHTLLVEWCGLQLLIALTRAGVSYRFSIATRLEKSFNPEVWAWIYVCGAAVSGLVWGSLPWLAMDTSSLVNTLIISLVMYGMIAASIGSHAPFLPAFFAYAYPVACLLGLRLIMEEGSLTIVGLLLFVFLLPNTLYAVNLRRIIHESIARRFEIDGLLVDVQQKRQEAEQANQDKSRFLASTSHDLRQPLHALDLYLGVLCREPNEEKRLEYLAKARQSSTILGELLNALLDISRLDAGNIQAEKRLVALPQLLEECVAEFSQQAAEKGIDLRLRMQHGACALTDPMLFGRMVRNLLSNAVRHTDSGKVLLTVRRMAGQLRIEVWDTGPGIAMDKREAIFSEFFQLNNPERDREKGLGLGLAIVKRLSLLLDHPLALKSTLGKGSCFAISLPACIAGDQCSTPMPVNDVGDISGMFVLLIDDDASILDAMRSWLRTHDCEVLTAASGTAMLAELNRLEYPTPDVIVSDYRLPDEENGVLAVQAIRNYFNVPLPAIIISGDTAADVAKEVNQAHCLFLSKPVQENRLLQVLASFSSS